MIDGTALVLLGTLVLVALGRAAYRAIFDKGWHAGRADLLREQRVYIADRTTSTVTEQAHQPPINFTVSQDLLDDWEPVWRFEREQRDRVVEGFRRLTEAFDQEAE